MQQACCSCDRGRPQSSERCSQLTPKRPLKATCAWQPKFLLASCCTQAHCSSRGPSWPPAGVACTIVCLHAGLSSSMRWNRPAAWATGESLSPVRATASSDPNLPSGLPAFTSPTGALLCCKQDVCGKCRQAGPRRNLQQCVMQQACCMCYRGRPRPNQGSCQLRTKGLFRIFCITPTNSLTMLHAIRPP